MSPFCHPPTLGPLTSRRAASARGQDPLILCLEGRRWCLEVAHLPPHPTPQPSALTPYPSPLALALALGYVLPTWLRVLCDFCIQARHWS